MLLDFYWKKMNRDILRDKSASRWDAFLKSLLFFLFLFYLEKYKFKCDKIEDQDYEYREIIILK